MQGPPNPRNKSQSNLRLFPPRVEEKAARRERVLSGHRYRGSRNALSLLFALPASRDNTYMRTRNVHVGSE